MKFSFENLLEIEFWATRLENKRVKKETTKSKAKQSILFLVMHFKCRWKQSFNMQ